MQERSFQEALIEPLVDLEEDEREGCSVLFVSHPAAFPLAPVHNHIFILHSQFAYPKSAVRPTWVLAGLHFSTCV